MRALWTVAVLFAVSAAQAAELAPHSKQAQNTSPSPFSHARDEMVKPGQDWREPTSEECRGPIEPKQGYDWHQVESYYPGLFNGIGNNCRYWQGISNTSLDTNRTFTQTFDLARALSMGDYLHYLRFVVRLRAGMNALLDDGFYFFDGPIFALGLRDKSFTGNHAFEVGVRVIPNWSGPHNSDAKTQQLALGSAISSSMADDALWLPLTNFAAQLYLEYDSRTHPIHIWHGAIVVGLKWYAAGSLGPMQIASWLGPQSAFVGNVSFETYLGIPRIVDTDFNVQTGLHGEISLSSIWPESDLFPALFDWFVGWSPKTWFALRTFVGGGAALTDLGHGTTHFGARLEFYIP
jgi:hypothetical protein